VRGQVRRAADPSARGGQFGLGRRRDDVLAVGCGVHGDDVLQVAQASGRGCAHHRAELGRPGPGRGAGTTTASTPPGRSRRRSPPRAITGSTSPARGSGQRQTARAASLMLSPPRRGMVRWARPVAAAAPASTGSPPASLDPAEVVASRTVSPRRV
jgi:hypothetical protein